MNRYELVRRVYHNIPADPPPPPQPPVPERDGTPLPDNFWDDIDLDHEPGFHPEYLADQARRRQEQFAAQVVGSVLGVALGYKLTS